MNKAEATNYLRQRLNEIPTLAKLRYDNSEYPLWIETIRGVVEKVFGPESSEYQKLAARYQIWGVFEDTRQNSYIQNLKKRETAILSIIRTYETLGIETKPSTLITEAPKAFISHGKESVALSKLESFLRELGIEPFIVKDKASLDKDVSDKVNSYLSQAEFVVILATGDDEVEGKLQPRQNVIHEIGLAQKTHSGKIIYFLEETAEFPSNIRPKVYERFTQECMENVFLRVVIELKALGVLRATKPQVEE